MNAFEAQMKRLQTKPKPPKPKTCEWCGYGPLTSKDYITLAKVKFPSCTDCRYALKSRS